MAYAVSASDHGRQHASKRESFCYSSAISIFKYFTSISHSLHHVQIPRAYKLIMQPADRVRLASDRSSNVTFRQRFQRDGWDNRQRIMGLRVVRLPAVDAYVRIDAQNSAATGNDENEPRS